MKKALKIKNKVIIYDKTNKKGTEESNTGALLFLVIGMLFIIFSFPREKVLIWPTSTVVTDREGEPFQGLLSSSGEWSLPIAYEKMGAWMPKVVVALEDQRFYTHSGIDPVALVRAMFQNRLAGRTVSGGSTITSQVIRLSIKRDRTFINKMVEFWQATQLEQILTKEGILELYLNKASFGGNIRGVEAASWAWFNRPAKELSLGQSALLAGILRGPAIYRPDRYPERALKLRNRLIETLAERGTVTQQEAERAKLEAIPLQRFPIPTSFRQTSEQVIKQAGISAERDRFGRIRSTIDMRMQNLLKAELWNTMITLSPEITAAAVLVENETGSVRGYIGNAREGKGTDAAWVDCADAPRSPGSVLKPFIYALAFQSGRLTPGSMLADTPISMQGNAPRNFDRLYRGPVSARMALADSLNVPAVRVLRKEGIPRVLDLYRRLGFKYFTKDASWYNDSLALGGCEVSPLELAEAYRTLAVGGVRAPLKWIEKQKPAQGERVLSAGASALTIDILKDTRRILPLYREIFGEDGTVIAFKTGTSYGLRDAWTAAVTKKYTLIIWFGDPLGRPHSSLVGLSTAAPVAVRIMRKLTPVGTKWFLLPEEVKTREVCPLSGAPRGLFCPQGVKDLYIEDISVNEPCALHVMENGNPSIRWPEGLDGFFLDPARVTEDSRLEIISPKAGAVYDMPENGGKIKFSTEGSSGILYWFVDGELYDSAGSKEALFWNMKEGRHKISVAEEDGRSAEANIVVRVTTKNDSAEEPLPLLEEME